MTRMVDSVLLEGFYSVLWWASLALLAFSIFAFVDSALRREDAFRATDKQTKQFWLIILGLNVVINLLLPAFFLRILGLIAVIVYMVDVRPAIKSISGGGGDYRGRGSSSDGPYGPYNGGR